MLNVDCVNVAKFLPIINFRLCFGHLENVTNEKKLAETILTLQYKFRAVNIYYLCDEYSILKSQKYCKLW